MARDEFVNLNELEDLLTAFRNIKCPYWAIYYRRQLLHANESDDLVESENLLRDTAELYAGNSAAIYTLCIYRGHKKGQPITNKTEYTNSINFRLNNSQADTLGEAKYMERYGYPPGGKNIMDALQKVYNENSALKIKLTQLEAKASEPEEETWADKIGGIVDALGMGEAMPYLGKHLVNKIMGINTANTLSGPQTQQQPKERQSEPTAENELIKDAIERIKPTVPDIAELLQKLAAFAEGDPEKFKFYMSHL